MPKIRRGLGDLIQEETKDLLGNANLTDLQTQEVTESVERITNEVDKGVTKEDTDLQGNNLTKSVTETLKNPITDLQSCKDTDLQSNKQPKYLKLERKEARLRQDQIDALTEITRKLNRMKRGQGGERITDNTLIRLAIDLFISRADELQGATEEELRKSLNL